ncbi:class A beta-lactamase [Bacillus sp. NP157]|nr:class A beta-lactamase [Bacillus sp. NP157]
MFIQLLRGTALALVASTALAAAPPPAPASLQNGLQAIANKASPGTMGIMVLDLKTHATTRVNADRPYLMMSVFKAPIAAAVLARVDAGTLALDRKVRLVPADIVDGSAVPSVGAQLKAGPRDYSVDELLHAAVTQSDNTAVDALLRLLGGGAEATRYLTGKGVRGMRIDMGERDLATQFTEKSVAAVLASHVNSTTPDGAVDFLRMLQEGKLLSPASTTKLLGMMTAQVIPNRIRAGLPTGFQLADKTGTSGSRDGRMAAFNDIGIVTAPNGDKRVVVVFLADAPATPEQATAWFAEVGGLVAADMQK